MNLREKSVRKRLRRDGWDVIKAGWPDFLCVRGNLVKAVEVKSPRDILSIRQKRVHRALQMAGIPTEVIVEDYTPEGMTTITVRGIPTALWNQIKAQASLGGQSVSVFVAEVLRKAASGKAKQ